MSEPRALIAAIIELAIATAGKEPDEATIAVYAKHLSRFELTAILAAIDKLILTAKFFPSVGEIVAAMRPDDVLEGAQAWASAIKAASAGPNVDRDALVPPAVREVVRRIGGWNELGHTPSHRIHFLERRFLELYSRVADRLAPLQLAADIPARLRA